jgi:membrane protein implicated in regulation of membrane protease activity
MRPLTKYVLLQIPDWIIVSCILFALWEWLGLRFELAVGLFALWLAKDIVLYPILRSAYESGAATGAERLVGERAVARGDLAPRGFVQVRGELWRAEVEGGGEEIRAGSAVRIVAARRLTLIVEADRDPA